MKARLFSIFFLIIFGTSCQLISTPQEKKKLPPPSNLEGENIPKPKTITRLEDFAKIIDADKDNTPPKDYLPAEGGSINVRLPIDPRLLSPVISNEGTANTIMGYVYDSLITRDPETFEWLPWLAYAWEVRDVALQNGKEVEGFFDEASGLFYPGRGLFHAADVELKTRSYGLYQIKNLQIAGKRDKVVRYTAAITPPKYGGFKPATLKKNVVYVFYLRDQIKWHDGFPFSAEDILFSFDIINNPFTDAAHLRNYYRDIRKLEILNSHSVKFTYEKPYFLSLSFCGGMPLLPKHRYNPERFRGDQKSLADYFNQHPDNWKPIGTGPYLFDTWDKGRLIRLTKNKNFWARSAGLPYFKANQPYLDQIQFIIVNNSNAALKELTSGNIDADFEVTQSSWEDPRANSQSFTRSFVRAKFLIPLYTYIGWNLERPFFQDPKVRKALTYLIPKQKILKEIHKDLGQLVTGPFFIEGPTYDHSLPPLYYNPVKARALLKEAGWLDHDGDGIRDKDGVPFQFEYLIHNAREYHQKIADIMKESLEEAGIIMNIRLIDWTVFAKTVMERNFDAVRFAWGTGIDGDPFQIWHSSQIGGGGSNYVGYKNPEIDKILEEARTLFNPLDRWKLYLKMHQILYEEQPYTFLFSFYTLGFYNRKYYGVKFYSGGYNFTEWFIPQELQKK